MNADYATGQISRSVYEGYFLDVSSRINLYPGLVPFFKEFLLFYPHVQTVEIYAPLIDATGLRCRGHAG